MGGLLRATAKKWNIESVQVYRLIAHATDSVGFSHKSYTKTDISCHLILSIIVISFTFISVLISVLFG